MYKRQAENRPIEGGPTVDGMTVVKSGLKAGERVVVSGQYRLKPGVKVSAAAQTTPRAALHPHPAKTAP